MIGTGALFKPGTSNRWEVAYWKQVQLSGMASRVLTVSCGEKDERTTSRTHSRCDPCEGDELLVFR